MASTETTESIQCYMCYEPETVSNKYACEPRPCLCKGSIEIHERCLKGIIENRIHVCSICKNTYNDKYMPKRNGLKIIINYLDNGYVSEHTVTESGKRHGIYTLRNNEGQILQSHLYVNDILEGPALEYYPNGEFRSLCRFSNNKLEGEYTEWNSDGTIKEITNYVGGYRLGESTIWTQVGMARVANTKIWGEGEDNDNSDDDDNDDDDIIAANTNASGLGYYEEFDY